jgi:branched-chain amino acid transport system ATP-binding protein
MTVLEVDSLEVRYNRSAVAVDGVSFAVEDGAIAALLGPNGAGKTSVIRALGGLLPGDQASVTKGDIRFFGRSVLRQPPHRRARRGLAVVPEQDKIFRTLTVEDNLRVSDVGAATGDGPDPRDLIGDLFPILNQRAHQVAGLLSGGERQMLAVAMALMGRPRLIVADEISLGIAPILVSRLMKALRQINAETGVSILLAEQNARAALDVADHIYVMEAGRVTMARRAESVEAQAVVRQFYLGDSLGDSLEPARPSRESSSGC